MFHLLVERLERCLLIAVTVVGFAGSAMSQMCGPNSYAFSSAQYFASGSTTNVTVAITFSCGCPGLSGHVDFTTADGSALAYQDYMPTNGSLTFANCYSPAVPVQIQIKPQRIGTPTKTIRLLLIKSASDPGANLSTAALLTINLPPAPNLTIQRETGDSVTISWLADGTDVLLEKSISPVSTNWTSIDLFPWFDGGTRYVTDTTSNTCAFYRLRRPQ
jgi:hypothetical protein